MSGGFVVGVAVGVLIGSAVTLLFTPRSGVETRRELSTWGAEQLEAVEPRNSVDELFGIASGLTRWLLKRLTDAMAGGRTASVAARESLSDEWAGRLRGEKA